MAMLSGIIKTTEEALPAGEFPQLRLSQIRRDGGTQPREGINEDHVANMLATLEGGGSLPAIEVMYDGTDYWLVNGFHRCAAHAQHGADLVTVIIKQGTLDDAKWESLGANRELPRTQREIERNIKDALRHPKSAGMSNRALGAHLGVDHKTVGKYRSELQTTGEIPQSTQRTGADGRTIDTTNIGKKPDDIEEKCRKLQTWLLGKGWAVFISGGERGVEKKLVRLSWPQDYDGSLAAYEKLRTAERYERGDLPFPVPAPTMPPPLTFDETMSLVWRVVKAQPAPLGDTGTLWRIYHAWLQSHEAPGDYRDQVPEGRRLDAATLKNARITIMNELEKNLEHQQRTEEQTALHDGVVLAPREERTKVQASRLTKEQCMGIIAAYLDTKHDIPDRQLDYFFLSIGHPEYYHPFVPEGYVLDNESQAFLDAFASTQRRLRMAANRASLAADQAAANVKQVLGMAQSMDAEIQAILTPDRTSGLIDQPPAAGHASAPPSPPKSEANVLRSQRMRDMLSVLETALKLIGDDYGNFTGLFSHAPAARRALEPMIAALKSNLSE